MQVSKYKKITNRIASSVVIEDLKVYLPGKGSWTIVLAASAEASKDLRENRHLVKLESIQTENPMPVWPFIKSPPPKRVPSPEPDPGPRELKELLQSVRGIQTALQELLLRPSPAPADVLAAHVQAIQQRGGIPPGLPGGPDPSEDPLFIPSQIIPKDTDADIQAREGKVQKDNFDEGANALKRARGK
jgi:hypothetical protein